MLFSSVTFIYLYLPAVLFAYYLAPGKWKNHILLLASLMFYFFGEPVYVLLLLASSLSDWLHSLLIEQKRDKPAQARALLISSLLINLLMLGFFKYTDFFISSFNQLFGKELPLLGLRLPIGISFFTFQTMSYTIDVYRGRVQAQRNLATMATFVCLFPQLIAGPIVRYSDIATELEDRQISRMDVAAGIRRFTVGLAKKVLLANVLGELVVGFTTSSDKSVLFYWLYALAFSLQIYFDFSGYSDMAVGLGRMLGFTFPENFNYPFLARSITEFWRRWHMTLGGWFRDYVYIPLGGNRTRTQWQWLRNILFVWLLTGLWHGAAWNFVFWGLYFAILLVLEKLFLLKRLEKSSPLLSHLYVLFLIGISFVIFNASSLAGAAQDLKAMFGLAGLPFWSRELFYQARNYALPLSLACFAATPLARSAYAKIAPKKLSLIIEPAGVIFLLLASSSFIIDGSFNPFLYFRF